MLVPSLGQEDPLETMTSHSNFLAWRIPWTEEPGGLQFIGSHRIGHDWSDLAHHGVFIWWPGKNCCSLAGEFWFIHSIDWTLHLQVSIYFGLYKILLMEKISIPWKTVKGTWNSSLLRKIKSFGKTELWHCLKNSRKSSGAKWWRLSIKVLVKMKNVFLHYSYGGLSFYVN